MSTPSYHDLHITTADLPRTSIFNLPYGYEVSCNRVGGLGLWRGGVKVAGEYDRGLRLDVGGHVICAQEAGAGMSEQESFEATFIPVGGMRFETAHRFADGRHDHSEGVFCDINETWPDGASIFCEHTTFQQIDDHGRLVERAEWAARRDAKRRTTPLDRDALVALICRESS